MKLSLIIIIPLSLLLVFLLLSNQAAPIVYAQPTGWVELVGERTRTGKSFFDPSKPGSRLLEISVAKIHYDGPDWKDIDNTLVPSLANVPTLGLVDLEMTTDDYEFYALQILNTIPLWAYLNKSAPDIYITFNPQGIQWTNDLDQIDLISMPQSVIGTITNNNLHWENAYGPGINLTLSAQAGRLAKALTLESMPQAPAQYILDGGNPALELRFIFGIPSGPNAPEIWIDGVLWGQSARTETVNAVDFKISGNTLFSFASPTVVDNNRDSTIPSFVFTKQGPNLRVAIRVPLVFLQNAVYPVIIDPTIDEQIGNTLDDGYSTSLGSFSTTLIRVGNISATQHRDAFLRFTTVTIPDNWDSIDVAYLTVQSSSTGNDGPGTRTNIYGNDEDSASAPTTRANHVTKVRTTAFTAWDDVDMPLDADTVSPSIISVIEEITSRPGWSSGNQLMILWDHDAADLAKRYAIYDYEEDTAKAAKLHVEYTLWVNTVPIITTSLTIETVDVNVTYNQTLAATDPDTNQTLQWELNATNTPFTLSVWNNGNRSSWVNGTPDTIGSFYVNITVGDEWNGNATDYVNYTLVVVEPILEVPDTTIETALFFMVGFIPFLMAIGIGFWKESGPMLFIGGLIGILLGLWVMVSIYWVFGFSFVGISILFMYIGWVNRDYMG